MRPATALMVDQLEGPDSEIVNKLNTAYRKVLVVGNDVYVPPIYSHRQRPYQFSLRQLRFLYYLAQTNDFGKACTEAEVSETFARRFLKSKDYREFASEAVEDQAIHDGWTPRRVILEIDRIYKGEKVLTMQQMEALKMAKEILVPKHRDAATGPGGVTVNLNFPALPADVQSKLKDIADQAAAIDTHAA